MSVVAWDGLTLAADKRAVIGSLYRKTTKIFRLNDCLVGYAGDTDKAEELKAWWAAGAAPKEFPESCRDDSRSWASLLVISKGDLLHYQRTPYPVRYDKYQAMAIGSGRDFALAAMHLGKSAAEAVDVACALDSGCGDGVDILTLEEIAARCEHREWAAVCPESSYADPLVQFNLRCINCGALGRYKHDGGHGIHWSSLLEVA